VGSEIENLIDGRRAEAAGGGRFEKLRPADGSVLCTVPRSDQSDVAAAVAWLTRAFGFTENYRYGERQFVAEDLEGHRWLFACHVRDVAPSDWGARTPS